MLSAEIAATRAAGGPGGLCQGALQPVVRLIDVPVPAFAGRLVIRRAYSRPGSQMMRRGETAHVRSDLRNNFLSCPHVKSRYVVQLFDRLLLQRAHHLLDSKIERVEI